LFPVFPFLFDLHAFGTERLRIYREQVVRSIGAFMPGLGCEAFVGGISTKVRTDMPAIQRWK